MSKNIDREKEIKLLHLDNVQKEILHNIISNFIKKKNITGRDVVEAFVSYNIGLVEDSASGAKLFCDDRGNLASHSVSQIQKFVDALKLCSKYNINHYKILNSLEINELLAKATAPRNRLTMQHINELEYKLRIKAYSMLGSKDTEFEKYMEDSEEMYISSLTSINPVLMKNAFIEHIVDKMIEDDEHTLDDVMNLVNKYAKYLGTDALSEEVVEGLIQKYSTYEQFRDSGLVHAARIEVFKLLEAGNE